MAMTQQSCTKTKARAESKIKVDTGELCGGCEMSDEKGFPGDSEPNPVAQLDAL